MCITIFYIGAAQTTPSNAEAPQTGSECAAHSTSDVVQEDWVSAFQMRLDLHAQASRHERHGIKSPQKEVDISEADKQPLLHRRVSNGSSAGRAVAFSEVRSEVRDIGHVRELHSSDILFNKLQEREPIYAYKTVLDEHDDRGKRRRCNLAVYGESWACLFFEPWLSMFNKMSTWVKIVPNRDGNFESPRVDVKWIWALGYFITLVLALLCIGRGCIPDRTKSTVQVTKVKKVSKNLSIEKPTVLEKGFRPLETPFQTQTFSPKQSPVRKAVHFEGAGMASAQYKGAGMASPQFPSPVRPPAPPGVPMLNPQPFAGTRQAALPKAALADTSIAALPKVPFPMTTAEAFEKAKGLVEGPRLESFTSCKTVYTPIVAQSSSPPMTKAFRTSPPAFVLPPTKGPPLPPTSTLPLLPTSSLAMPKPAGTAPSRLKINYPPKFSQDSLPSTSQGELKMRQAQRESLEAMGVTGKTFESLEDVEELVKPPPADYLSELMDGKIFV